MNFLRPALFFGRPPRPSPAVNAAPVVSPVFLGFDLVANAAPALTAIRLRFDIVADAPGGAG